MTWDGVEKRSADTRIAEIDKRLLLIETFITSELGGHGTKGNINYHLERIEKLLQEHVAVLNAATKRMESIVLGEDGSTGLPARVKIIEESSKNHRDNIRIIWVAIVGVVVNAIWKFITISFVK